jgi:hypothetical protein
VGYWTSPVETKFIPSRELPRKPSFMSTRATGRGWRERHTQSERSLSTFNMGPRDDTFMGLRDDHARGTER